jgi:hypothetical protein
VTTLHLEPSKQGGDKKCLPRGSLTQELSLCTLHSHTGTLLPASLCLSSTLSGLQFPSPPSLSHACSYDPSWKTLLLQSTNAIHLSVLSVSSSMSLCSPGEMTFPSLVPQGHQYIFLSKQKSRCFHVSPVLVCKPRESPP